ncbi:polysaccharide biosynthesis/export family protein [Quatrionicoccus australiensis]|uniref:polysaccharide biosynthesis/export family protein n=1 Tax=Quatrionicoccus australiensis TaxID=138118 RepID=UPI001CFADC1C|nr:polysaccharide biosynthesis/export family protein [Quatrionicoccus australiensis]MCB4358679.1 polysaccharide export protein [Quatrionicoccus australiensis]
MISLRQILALLCLCAGLVTGQVASAQSADVPALQGNEDRNFQFTPSGLSVYKLAAGDVISIRVLGEDDLNREKIRLTDAGSISYPALGEIRVMNMTIGDLEKIITDGLRGRFLVNPKVSVQIDEYRPFYINGMVDKPGGYPFQPGLTVRKAASLAGGFKERASVNKVFIIRESDPAQRSQNASLNSPVYPGDIVTVEESFF